MSREDLQVNFRIPAELKRAIEAAAEKNKRSITAELVARLEESFFDGDPSPAERYTQQSMIKAVVEETLRLARIEFDEQLKKARHQNDQTPAD